MQEILNEHSGEHQVFRATTFSSPKKLGLLLLRKAYFCQRIFLGVVQDVSAGVGTTCTVQSVTSQGPDSGLSVGEEALGGICWSEGTGAQSSRDPSKKRCTAPKNPLEPPSWSWKWSPVGPGPWRLSITSSRLRPQGRMATWEEHCAGSPLWL